MSWCEDQVAVEPDLPRPRHAGGRRPFGPTTGRETPARKRLAVVSAASKGLWTLSLAAAAGWMAGCTSHHTVPLQHASEIAAEVAYPEGADPLFEYPHAVVPFDNHILGVGATPDYSLRKLEIPSVGDNGQKDRTVRAEYYRSESPAPRPLIIVLPIFARYTYPSQKLSTFLQKQSRGAVHVLNVAGESFLFDWAGLTETSDPEVFMELVREGTERERTVVIDIRRLVDWAEQQPEIDGSRVALVGFSRSAIVAGVAATQEARLAATVLVMGGARPHEIVARCVGKRTSAVQRNARRQLGWDQDELEARIRPVFSGVDAANYPGRVDPEKVLMFEASRDECIQESARMALWESLGRPERISLNYGHRIAFAAMTPLGGNWICHRTWEFLERRLLSTDESS